MSAKILIVLALLSFACKPRTEETQTKYAIPKKIESKGSIFELINKPNATLKVCLFNEDPSSLIGRNYLNYLEEDFREGLHSWTAVAAEHPSWVGPAKPQVIFQRFSFNEYLSKVDHFRKKIDPATISKIEEFLAGPHMNMDESWERFEKIILGLNLKAKAVLTAELECHSSVSIFGFTSKSKAIDAYEYIPSFPLNLYTTELS